MSGPQNAVVGDDAFGTDLPQTQVDDSQEIADLQRQAKFLKTADYKELKNYLESRINFYQTYLPNGDPVITKAASELGPNWLAANVVVGEFRALLNAYEQSAVQLKEINAARRATS